MAGTTDITLKLVETTADAAEFLRWLDERRTWLAVDTETAGFHWWRQPLRTVQFGDRHTGWCLESDRWWGTICEALEKYDRPIAMHNMKFDMHFLEEKGAKLKRWLIHDTRAMAHIVNPATASALKVRAAVVLGPWASYGEDELKMAMSKGGWDFATVPIELLWRYAAFDTCLTAQLADELYPIIHASRLDVYGLELAHTQVLLDMEKRGILTDRRYLEWAKEEWTRDMEAVRHRIHQEYGVANPNADRQVIDRLRAAGWQPVLFTDKGNVKLDRTVLEGLADAGVPLAAAVMEYRDVHKIVGTYVDNLIDLADANGRIHASINPLGARTGRSSVSSPSLQNLPAKDARIRDAFVASQGDVLVTADYDQVEMRIFAHYAQSENMLAAIRYGDAMTEAGHKGYDLHSMNARLVFHVPMDAEVPPAFRKRVKGVGFGKIFGAGPETFAATAGITVAEAVQTIAQFEQAFPETAKHGFPAKVAARLHATQAESGDPHVDTVYGRKQPCWPSEAYKAVNYLIQGTAADVLKDRTVALSRTWLGEHLLLPIHDELLFEVPQDAVHEAEAVIREVMPERERFAVPLTVDVESTLRWGSKYRDTPLAAHGLA